MLAVADGDDVADEDAVMLAVAVALRLAGGERETLPLPLRLGGACERLELGVGDGRLALAERERLSVGEVEALACAAARALSSASANSMETAMMPMVPQKPRRASSLQHWQCETLYRSKCTSASARADSDFLLFFARAKCTLWHPL